jgi:hypothetical protein
MIKRGKEQSADETDAAGRFKAAIPQPGKKVSAGFSGAVVGTVMTYLSSRIDDPETKKSFLLSIPTVSVAVTGGVYKVMRWYQKRSLDQLIAAAQARHEANLRGQLEDPILSEEAKKQARMDYEKSKLETSKDDQNSLRMLVEIKKQLSNEGVG